MTAEHEAYGGDVYAVARQLRSHCARWLSSHCPGWTASCLCRPAAGDHQRLVSPPAPRQPSDAVTEHPAAGDTATA